MRKSPATEVTEVSEVAESAPAPEKVTRKLTHIRLADGVPSGQMAVSKFRFVTGRTYNRNGIDEQFVALLVRRNIAVLCDEAGETSEFVTE